ncbi:hypothetical protein ACFL54_05935 [Planctomycetota bacterium]
MHDTNSLERDLKQTRPAGAPAHWKQRVLDTAARDIGNHDMPATPGESRFHILVLMSIAACALITVLYFTFFHEPPPARNPLTTRMTSEEEPPPLVIPLAGSYLVAARDGVLVCSQDFTKSKFHPLPRKLDDVHFDICFVFPSLTEGLILFGVCKDGTWTCCFGKDGWHVECTPDLNTTSMTSDEPGGFSISVLVSKQQDNDKLTKEIQLWNGEELPKLHRVKWEKTGSLKADEIILDLTNIEVRQMCYPRDWVFINSHSQEDIQYSLFAVNPELHQIAVQPPDSSTTKSGYYMLREFTMPEEFNNPAIRHIWQDDADTSDFRILLSSDSAAEASHFKLHYSGDSGQNWISIENNEWGGRKPLAVLPGTKNTSGK